VAWDTSERDQADLTRRTGNTAVRRSSRVISGEVRVVPPGRSLSLKVQLGTEALGSVAGIGASAPGMWSCCRLSTAGCCPPAGPWA